MAKLTILVATLAALLLLVDASIHKTTVIIDEEANPRGMEEDCRQEMMRQQNLKHCQMHIMQEMRTGPGRDEEEEHFDMCCKQLREMSTMCRCDGLKMAIEQMQQRTIEREDVPVAMSMAKTLPNKCGMEPQECQFGSRYNW